MNYRIPPDVIHYEVKLMLGLTAQDLMISGMAIITGVQVSGILVGLVAGLLSIGGLKRFETLGNRSLLVYFIQSLWYQYRPVQVLMPRVMPSGKDLRMSVQDWDGQELFRLGEET